MEKQAKPNNTTSSSVISSLPFDRIREVDPKTDEDWTEKLAEMSSVEAEQALQAEHYRKAKEGIWPYAERFTIDDASKEDSDSDSDEELGGMEVDINNESIQPEKRKCRGESCWLLEP